LYDMPLRNKTIHGEPRLHDEAGSASWLLEPVRWRLAVSNMFDIHRPGSKLNLCVRTMRRLLFIYLFDDIIHI